MVSPYKLTGLLKIRWNCGCGCYSFVVVVNLSVGRDYCGAWLLWGTPRSW